MWWREEEEEEEEEEEGVVEVEEEVKGFFFWRVWSFYGRVRSISMESSSSSSSTTWLRLASVFLYLRTYLDGLYSRPSISV